MEHASRCCEHNRCLDHSPDWEQVGEPKLHLLSLKLNPLERFFNFLKWLFGGPLLVSVLNIGRGEDSNYCCGRSLLYCRMITHRICQKCGRNSEEELAPYLYCPCCGYKKSTHIKPIDLSIFQVRYMSSDSLNKLMESRGIGIKVTDEPLLLRDLLYGFAGLMAFIYFFIWLTLSR